MLTLSFGGVIKLWLYPHLPLLQYIRTNGEYRVFALFCFIVMLSFSFEQVIKSNDTNLLNKVLLIFACICLITIVSTGISKLGIFQKSYDLTGALSDRMKWWLDNLQFNDRLFINAFILLFLLLLYRALKKRLPFRILLPGIITCDLIIFCWLDLPITGVQKRSVASIETYFSEIRKGIPTPRLAPLKDNIDTTKDLNRTIGCWAYYSKEPGTPEQCDYPTLFWETDDYFRSGLPGQINKRAFIFLKNDTAHHPALSIQKFSPTEIRIETLTNTFDTLVLLQNYYPEWKVTVNDQPAEIKKEYISFMSVPVSAGRNSIRFYFQNKMLTTCLFISLGTLLAILLFHLKLPMGIPLKR